MKKFTLLGAEAIGATLTRPDRPIAFFCDRLGTCGDISAGGDVARTRRRRAAVLRDARRIQWPRERAAGLRLFRLPSLLQAAADMHGNCVVNIVCVPKT